MNTLQDARFALRALAKARGFAAVAVTTLALGIGANTAIFSVVRGVLLRPLPFPRPERLVMVRETHPRTGGTGVNLTPANFDLLRKQARSLEGLAAWDFAAVNLTGAGEPERLRAASVTPDLFDVVGVHPALGRVFRADEAAGKSAAILSDGLWTRRFGADPAVLGLTVALDGRPVTVVGIMPKGFRFPIQAGSPELWLPLDLAGSLSSDMSGARFLKVVGRLRASSPDAAALASAELPLLSAALRRLDSDGNAGMGLVLVPLTERVVGAARPALVLLLCAVGLVLLIACANVASLLLARGADRQREIATRSALGASRGRIVAQLLTETLVLWLIGAALGCVLAVWGVRAFVSLAPADIPRLDEVAVDASVLGVALAAALLTGALFGAAPALELARSDVSGSLNDASRGTTAGLRRRRLRSGLAVAEISLALVLAVGATLLARSFWKLRAADPGFRSEGVATFVLTLPAARYATAPSITSFYSSVAERIAAVPGVVASGGSTHFPFQNRWRNPVSIEGRPAASPSDLPLVTISPVLPGYFETLGIPLKQGRRLEARDDARSPAVAVVDERAARRLFPDGSPIGRRMKLGLADGGSPWLTIVGVVGSVTEDPQADTMPEIYFPFVQLRPETTTMLGRGMVFAVRGEGDPLALMPAIKAQVQALDRDLPLGSVAPLADLAAEARSQRRFALVLVCAFGAIALALAAVGLYGVVAYGVARRTHEIGIRAALGATAADNVRLVAKEGLSTALVGLGLGIAGALALTRFLSGLLFGVSPTDPLTFAATAGLLALTALVASWLPARRAARVDPMEALRAS